MAIILATLIWGSSFVVLKNTLNSLPIMFLLSIRFLGAGVILSAIFFKKLPKLDKGYIISGGIIGLCLFLAYLFQTYGLAHTTPGKNAFLTAVYCVLVPFLYFITDKRVPTRRNILAAFVCIIGIGLVSLTEKFTVEAGDYLTLIGGFFFAAHIVAVTKLSRGRDPVLITILQFLFCGLFSAVGAAIFETIPQGWVASSWASMLYLTVFCTAVSLLCQNWGQAKLPPSNVAILLSLESVFGVIISVLLRQEMLSARLVVGFCMIFAAIAISES